MGSTLEAETIAGLVDVLGIGVARCDENGSLLGLTKAAATYLGHADVDSALDAGADPARIWSDPALVSEWLGALPSERREPFGADARLPNGTTARVTLQCSPRPGLDTPGEVTFLISQGSGSDGAGLERRLQMARVQSVASSSGAIAHKLNNVLSGLMGYTSLLRSAIESGSKPESIPRYLGLLEDATAKFLELTTQFMTIAQKAPAFPPEPVDIVNAIEAAIAEMPDDCSADLDSAAGPRAVMGNKATLPPAISFLVRAGALLLPDPKHTTVRVGVERPEAADLELLGTAPGTYKVVTIQTEHGPTDDEARERLFDPYFTAQAAGKGAELHLATALGTVVIHHGTVLVTADSETVTELRVFLPLESPSTV